MSIQYIIAVLNAACIGTDEQQQECLLIAQNHLNTLLKRAPDIADMGKIYTQEGYIPAIKEWRTITGCGLKEAKDKIDAAVNKYGWKSNLIGKTAAIICEDNSLHGKRCTIIDHKQGSNQATVSVLDCMNSKEYTTNVSLTWLRVTEY